MHNNRQIALMGSINSKDGKFLYQSKKKLSFDQNDTIDFLKQIMTYHKSTNDFCVFWDNASIHRGEDILEFIE